MKIKGFFRVAGATEEEFSAENCVEGSISPARFTPEGSHARSQHLDDQWW